MKGNLDPIAEIADQEAPQKTHHQQLATSYTLYYSEKETFFSYACTLFSDILKIQINSLFILFFQNILIILQFISTWYYSFLPFAWDKSTGIGKFILGLNCFLQLSKTNNPSKINLPSVIIPFIMNLFIDIFFFSLLIILKKRGLIARKTATIATIVFQFLLVIIYLPTFSAFASTFKFIVEKDPIAITFFILYIFVIGFMVVLLKLLSRLVCFPSNPTVSQTCTYDGQHLANLLFFEGFKILLVKITELYDKWFFILVFIIHILFIIYQIYDLLVYPFVHFWCVPFFYGIYSGVIACDILTLVTLLSHTLTLIRFIIPLIIFIVGWIIAYFVVRSHYNRIVEILDSKLITELEQVRYYEQLQIKNVRQATKYIHVGFSKLIPAAINGWLEIILARQFNNFDLWLLAGNLISFFPCNKAHLEECVEKLSSMHTSSTANRVLCIRLVQILRARDVLSVIEKDDKRDEMKALTSNTINIVKTFWKDISEKNDRIPASRIYSIAGAIDNAMWNWKEILSLYPNDPNLVENYSCFLVECLGKFKTGLKWKMKSNYLQSGYHAEIDPLFKSFLISMPRIWNEHMVDYFGHLQKDGATRSGAFEMISAQEQLEKDIDSGAFDREAERVFRWPHLRFYLTKAVSHYLPKGLRVFQFFKYIAFIAWFIVLFAITHYFSNSFRKINVHYEQMEDYHRIRVALNELRNIIFFNFAKKNDLLYTDEIYHSYLPEKAFYESEYRTFSYLDSSDSFSYWSAVAVKSLESIYQKITDHLSGENVSRIIEKFLDHSIEKIRKKDENEPIVIGNVSAKNAIIFLLWSYSQFSSLDRSEEQYDNFLKSSMIYETAYMHPKFSFYTDTLLEDLVLQATEKCKAVLQSNRNDIFILIFIPLFLFVPFIIIPLIIIHRNTLKIFKLLKSVDSESAKVASQRLSKISKINIDYTSVSSVKSKSQIIVVLIILYTFFMIAPFILCIFSYIIMKNSLNYFTSLIELSRFGNQRESLASEILSYVIILSTTIRIDNQEFYDFMINKVEIHQLIDKTTEILDQYNSYFSHGFENNKGIFSMSDAIRDLHLIDKCSADLTQSDMHPFYVCIGLERLISTFELYVSSFTMLDPLTAPDMKSELFVNLVHMSTSELYRELKNSQERISDLISITVNYSRELVIILFVFAIVAILVNIFIDFMLQRALLQSLNGLLVLLLHLPSPTIAENPSLYHIFLDRKSYENRKMKEDDDKDQYIDPKQIIFNTTQTPIMCIGDGFIIETINKAFCNAFDYSSEQLVGKKLTAFIENPIKDESDSFQSKFRERLASQNYIETDYAATEYKTDYKTDLKSDLSEECLAKFSNEEKGAIRMYQKMKSNNVDENTRSKYPIQCICGNDSIINTNVTVYPVRDNESLTISNFILKIENNRQFKDVERKLEDANSHFKHLQQQLIPRELDNYLKDKAVDNAFSAKYVTVVAVRPIDPFDELNESNDKFNELLQSIENTAYEHPPLMKVKTLFHIMFFVSGLFLGQNKNEDGEIIEDIILNDKNNKKDEENQNVNINQNKSQSEIESLNGSLINDENSNLNDAGNNVLIINNNNDNDNNADNANNVNNNTNNDNNNENNITGDDALHANASIEFAHDVRQILDKILPAQIHEEQKNDSASSFRIGKSKFAIAIVTGGPVVCCLTGDKHKSLEVIGDVLDDAFELLTHAPPKKIIFRESTKKLLKEENLEGVEIGPEIFNEKTYLL